MRRVPDVIDDHQAAPILQRAGEGEFGDLPLLERGLVPGERGVEGAHAGARVWVLSEAGPQNPVLELVED